MISYTLKCKEGHQFDSWFGSAAAYEALEKAGHLSCAICGGAEITKSLMAPRVTLSGSEAQAATPQSPAADAPVPVLSNPQTEVEKAVDELRRKVESTSDYVGNDFTTQARAMHEGSSPERPIYGEARLDQARKLAEDGVPIVPLPFRPKQKLT